MLLLCHILVIHAMSDIHSLPESDDLFFTSDVVKCHFIGNLCF